MTQLKRPKALSDLITLLDESGWSYAVQHGRDSGGARWITVTGLPHWDDCIEVRATWHSRDTGTLRLFSCMARQAYRGWRDLSLRATRGLVTAEPDAEPAEEAS